MKKKVLIGMSGGIDSSVAAYLLKKEGYDVVGVTMQMCNGGNDNCTDCPLSAIEDARKVASKLNIPHHVFDFKQSFDKKVVQYFISEYLKGRTPNPCVICNREVKFEELLKKADDMGIEYVATGHYSRIVKPTNSNGRYFLKKGTDLSKDQSYFLYRLSQKQLSKTIFPLGELKKKEVRKIANNIGLEVGEKADSQEICFIEDNNYSKFIQENTDTEFKKGNIVDLDGNVIGKHTGIHNFTVGQRKGIKTSSNEPLYVIQINTARNEVVVGGKESNYTKKLIAKDLNWISIEELNKPLKVKAKIRSRSKDASCTISNIKNKEDKQKRVLVDFDKKQRAITPGQSVVFYNGDVVVGGGIIE